MKVSLEWLRDYVDIDVSVKDYCDAMTMSGTKVEGYETLGADISNVVVGRVDEIKRHENSDHLFVCSIDVGKTANVQIVTGAQNVSQGDLVPAALDGAVLPGSKTIKSGKLRGVVSDGMLCSLSELGLTTHDFPYAIEDGIFILQEKCVPGEDIRKVCRLNDTVVDFELTFNRPDCLGFIGIARESAAALKKQLTLPKVSEIKGKFDEKLLSVEVMNASLCPRYCAAMVKNVRIAPSPLWLRARLRAAGVRPINNIVDITNYVMLEYGQPMHAFDYSYIGSKRIIVRNAAEGEKIVTLDGTECALKPDMLVIADGEKPVALAGIMGGANSEILNTTECVVFESANFDRSTIRMTSRELNVRTDSSRRFEKGLAASNAMPALCRALELVKELDAGDVLKGCIDVCSADIGERTIPFEPKRINELLGTSLTADEMAKLLEMVDMKVSGSTLIVPPYRQDMENTADIAEEVVRLYGFDNIEPTLFAGRMTAGGLTARQKFDVLLRQTLVSLGCCEAYTYSFVSPASYAKAGLSFDSDSELVILNPLGEDTSTMRRSAVVSLLEVLARNYSRSVDEARVFELATVYKKRTDGMSDETKQLVVASYGGWDFYDMKGVCEQLCEALGVSVTLGRKTTTPYLHPGRCAHFEANGESIAVFGQIHPQCADRCGVPYDACIAVFDAEKLYAAAAGERHYKPLPVYPSITRDLALVCDENAAAGDIIAKMLSSGGKLVESAQVFDVYTGKGVEDGKKSIAFRLVLRSAEKTLSDADADAVVKRILKRLSFEDSITLRQ